VREFQPEVNPVSAEIADIAVGHSDVFVCEAFYLRGHLLGATPTGMFAI